MEGVLELLYSCDNEKWVIEEEEDVRLRTSCNGKRIHKSTIELKDRKALGIYDIPIPVELLKKSIDRMKTERYKLLCRMCGTGQL